VKFKIDEANLGDLASLCRLCIVIFPIPQSVANMSLVYAQPATFS
jgi:hypothetical protein